MTDTMAAEVLVRSTDETDDRTGVFRASTIHSNVMLGHLVASGTTVVVWNSPQWAEKLVQQYLTAVLSHDVVTEQDDEDGRWFAEIPALDGPWASGDSEAEARERLAPVVSDWLWLKIEDHDGDIPVMHGIDLNDL